MNLSPYPSFAPPQFHTGDHRYNFTTNSYFKHRILGLVFIKWSPPNGLVYVHNHVLKSQILRWLQSCNRLWKLFGMHGHLLPSWVLLLPFLRLSYYRAWGILVFYLSFGQEILAVIFFPLCFLFLPIDVQGYYVVSHRFFFFFFSLWIQVFVVRERSISQVLFQRADSSKVWSLPPICKNFIIVFLAHYFLLLVDCEKHQYWYLALPSMKELGSNIFLWSSRPLPDTSVLNFQIPTNRAGLIEYRCHPFWSQKYCPSHEHDNTARCCSCERLEVSIGIIEINSQIISYCAWTRLRSLPLVLTTIPYDFTVVECKIHFFGRRTKPMPRMYGVFYHGHGRLPTTLPLHPRLLRRNEHENRSANSYASSWKTGTKWSYCWGEACNQRSLAPFPIPIKHFLWSVLLLYRASITCPRLEVYVFLKSRLSRVYVFKELQFLLPFYSKL